MPSAASESSRAIDMLRFLCDGRSMPVSSRIATAQSLLPARAAHDAEPDLGIAACCALAYRAHPTQAASAQDSVERFYAGRKLCGGDRARGRHRLRPLRPRAGAPHGPLHPRQSRRSSRRTWSGVAGFAAANWLYNVAAKDGSVIAIFAHTAPFEPLLGKGTGRFDATQVHLDRQHGRGRRRLRRLGPRRHRASSTICSPRRRCSEPPAPAPAGR